MPKLAGSNFFGITLPTGEPMTVIEIVPNKKKIPLEFSLLRDTAVDTSFSHSLVAAYSKGEGIVTGS